MYKNKTKNIAYWHETNAQIRTIWGLRLTPTLDALCGKEHQTKAKSAWERKCCLSGGSGVLGSVLAAEMCPLDEPATAALSTFG